MVKNLKNSVWFFMLFIFPVAPYAQKDVTQFLGIPVDGYKPEMIQKLKSQGFTTNPHKEDILDGEFNGTDVNIFIGTNNNKIWRIAVADANTMKEGDIKIRFNNLCQQFQNNKNYLSLPDSRIQKYSIPEDEDISYELSVNNKRYEAFFYQKPADYDSLTLESNNLYKKEPFIDEDKERLSVILRKMFDAYNSNKVVWFSILERSGEYYITMFYENRYNRANGEGL